MELLPVVLLSATIGIGVGLLFGFLMSQEARRAHHIGSRGGCTRQRTRTWHAVVAAPRLRLKIYADC